MQGYGAPALLPGCVEILLEKENDSQRVCLSSHQPALNTAHWPERTPGSGAAVGIVRAEGRTESPGKSTVHWAMFSRSASCGVFPIA